MSARPASQRLGLTLFEVIAALIIAASVAAMSIRYLRPASETSKQRSCDMTRELLQNDANRYTEATGNRVSRDLIELQTAEYAGTVLPACPVTGNRYRTDRSGNVICPTHETSRAK